MNKPSAPHQPADLVVVKYVGMSLLLTIIGGIVLAIWKNGNADWLEKIALVLAGGLVGLLANVKSHIDGAAGETTNTKIVNDEPIPVVQTESEGGH